MKFKMVIDNKKVLEKRKDNGKTFLLGFIVVVLLVLVVLFGFSFLVRFTAFLGERKEVNGGVVNDNQLPPLPPRIFVPFEATNSAAINVSGTAESGTSIELEKDDILLDTINVDDDGEFVFENVLLNLGDNFFSAVAVSADGRRSEVSKEVSVVFDNEPPKLEMSNPVEESLTVDYEDFDVVGKVDNDVSVTVNGKIGLIDSEGNFKVKIQLQPGKNNIEIKVRDLAGNETSRVIEITYDF